MSANEFLHKKGVAYMNRMSTSLNFENIVSLMEEFASIQNARIDDFRFTCHKCNTIHTGENGDQVFEVCKKCFYE